MTTCACEDSCSTGRFAPQGRRWGTFWKSTAKITFDLVVLAMCWGSAAPRFSRAADPAADPSTPEELGLVVPADFQVTQFAGDDLAHDIFSMTIDAAGRVVVAGAGYIKTLYDDDGDGRADRATLFSRTPASGAHGLYWDGPDLICTGDNAVGRIRDADQDGVADGPLTAWTPLRHPEHGANGVTRGPDGWFYVICGNDSGLDRRHITMGGSPVPEPRCGGVLRISPDGQKMQVVAHGFRNPYDLDFAPQGELLTVDSDGERDQYLPWYSPTRLFDIASGMEHGWILQGWQRSWNRPACFFDNVPRLAEIGRGSPTGITAYRHHQFPPAYQGGVFSACWTTGRIYFFPLNRDGASYRTEKQVFLHATGDFGFDPVDLAVGPDGDLFIAIGGRGTRGSVFRVRYEGANEARPAVPPQDPLSAVLQAPQPLAAWSRARWLPLAEQLGAGAFQKAATSARPTAERVRAFEILVDRFGGINEVLAAQIVDAAQSLSAAEAAEVVARAAWAIGRSPASTAADQWLAKQTSHPSPVVQRAAWEALSLRPANLASDLALGWNVAFDSKDRRVRSAAIRLASSQGRASYRPWKTARDRPTSPAIELATIWSEIAAGEKLPPIAERAPAIERLATLAQRLPEDAAVERLEMIRLTQLLLGDLRVQPDQPEVYSGYSGNDVAQSAWLGTPAAAALFEHLLVSPAPQIDVRREQLRLAGMINYDQAAVREWLTQTWTSQSSVEDDLHALIVLSRLPGERTPEQTRRTAIALLALETKMTAGRMFPSRNWPARVGECVDGLLAHDGSLAEVLVALPEFGAAEHSLFAARLPAAAQTVATRKLLARDQQAPEDEAAWTPELVRLATSLPEDEWRPVLRARWEDFRVRDAIALALADHPAAEDRKRLVEAFDSPQPEVVERVALALTRLPGPGTPDEILSALQTLRPLLSVKQQRAPREALGRLLNHWTAAGLSPDEAKISDLPAAYQPWFEWFEKQHPQESQRLRSATDPAAWSARLAAIDWSQGAVERGQVVFEKRNCARCHRGTSRLGPDLVGVASRLSREDLLTAIIDPNKEVSPTYRTQSVLTRSGRIHTGLVVYESPESTLLMTGPDTTVRIGADEFQEMIPSRLSLMPVGLLNQATDAEIADLYAYLKSLRGK